MNEHENEFNIEPYSHSEDIPELPEELQQSEEAMKELFSRSQEDKYRFINVVVLAVVLLACASYFIALTGSKRYGDEGNKFSFERLANGKYTAEISRRYYSTIAYPEQITELSDSISSLYGVLDRSTAEQVRQNTEKLQPDEKKNQGGQGHRENEVTTASGETTGTETEASHKVETFYDTVFSRTTTTSTALGYDPDDPYSHKTTTTVNTEPDVESTTTEAPTVTTAQTVSSEETSPSETEPSKTETKPTQTETKPTETESTTPSETETAPSETTPSETESSGEESSEPEGEE